MNETRRWLCWWCALLVLAGTTGLDAEESRGWALDVDGDGREDDLRLQRQGELYRLTINGQPTEAIFPGNPVGPGSADIDRLEVGRGQAWRWRLPLADGRRAYEALWVGTTAAGTSRLVWHGVTGLRGEEGSRWGSRLLLEDLTGDGERDILLATVADEVPLCGVAQPELFPRAYDPRRQEFRPVLLNRLRSLTVSARPLRAERNRPAGLGPRPVAQVAHFVAASTTAGDRGQYQRLTAPRQLDDGDPTTSWTEGRPGPGRGEFVTARLLPGDYRVHSLAVTLAPATIEGQPAPNLARLRQFSLLLGSSNGLQRYDITATQDPARFPGEPLWLTLPEPTQVQCLSLVLGERWRPSAPETPTGLAEVAVFTDLDLSDGNTRVAQLLTQEGGGNEALLRALGPGVVPVIQEAWPTLTQRARRRAVRVLAATGAGSAAALLAEAALSDDGPTARRAQQGLRPLGDSAVTALAAQATDDDLPRSLRIAQLMALVGTASATSWLVGQVATLTLTESVPWTSLLARLLARSEADLRQEALRRAADVEGLNQYVLLAGLLPLLEEEEEPFAQLVRQAWDRTSSFESRYRLLALAGRAGSQPAVAELLSHSLLQAEDRYLRARAAEVVALESAEARHWLAQAAHDEWPGVRQAAARGLATIGPGRQVQVLADLLATDPWPVVRATAATALNRAEVSQAQTLLVAALADPAPLVQITVTRLLGRGRYEGALEPLTELANDEGASLKVRQAAVTGVGALCRGPAQAALLRWLAVGLEEDQPVTSRQLAAAAARALVPYGDPAVWALVARAAREGVPGIRLPAIEALGRGGREEMRPLLEQLTEEDLPPLRAAAAAALRLLDGPGSPERCPAAR